MDIEFLLWLQQIRQALGPGFEAVMVFITNLPKNPFVILIPALLYWAFNKRDGIFVLFSFAISVVVNQLIKNIFCIYRPWIRDPRVIPAERALPGATGYSFPSGHAQTSAAVLGGVAWVERKRKSWLSVICLLLAVAIALSRNILGVHTPQDVLVGVAIAVVALWGTDRLVSWVDDNPEEEFKVTVVLSALFVAALVFCVLKPYPMDYVQGLLLVDPKEMVLDMYEATGAALAAVIGCYLERRFVNFSTDVPVRDKVIRVFICTFVVIVVKFGFVNPVRALVSPELNDFMSSSLPVFAAVFLGPSVSEPLIRAVNRRWPQENAA